MVLAVLALLTGCTPTSQRAGTVELCFADEDIVDEPVMEPVRHDITATVTGVGTGPGTPCAASSRALLLEKSNGQAAWIGWTVADPDSEDVTPELAIAVGEQVTIVHQQSVSFAGPHHALTVVGEEGIWLAGKDWSAEALPAADMDGLQVEAGDDAGRVTSSDCGTQQAFETVFQGQALRQGERRDISVGAVTATAWNVASWRYEQLDCTDVWGPWSWLVFR